MAIDPSKVKRFAHGSRVPGWDEAADLTKDPAVVPDPATTPVPEAIRREIEGEMAKYPDVRSAAIPALKVVQREHGWCSPTAIEQAACVMRLTPGYLIAVATFYDMFDTVPVGAAPGLRVHEHLLLAARRRRALRRDALRRRRRPALQRAPVRVPGRVRHRADGLGRRRVRRPARGRGLPHDRRRRARRAAAVLEAKQLKRRKKAADALEGEHSRARSRRRSSTRTSTSRASNTLEVYEKRGGYEMLRKALKMEPQEVLEEMLASNVRGRGGAGFAMGKKMSFIPKGAMDKYLVCNADESEPGTFKDRELMQKNPHQLIEGIIIGAYAIGANKSFIFIRGEYAHQADVLDAALAEAREKGYVGEQILGSDHSLDLVVHRGAGAYICGEETALLDSLEGKRGNPRLKPPFPAIQGLYQRPDADQQRRDADERPDTCSRSAARSTRRSARRPRRARRSSPSRAASSARATTRSCSAPPRASSSSTSPAARPRAARSRRGSPAARAPRC